MRFAREASVSFFSAGAHGHMQQYAAIPIPRSFILKSFSPEFMWREAVQKPGATKWHMKWGLCRILCRGFLHCSPISWAQDQRSPCLNTLLLPDLQNACYFSMSKKKIKTAPKVQFLLILFISFTHCSSNHPMTRLGNCVHFVCKACVFQLFFIFIILCF